MNMAARNIVPETPVETPDDEDRNSLCALVMVLPPEARLDDDDHNGTDLVSVVMVGRGDGFARRAREYQERHAAAFAEWEAWDKFGGEWDETFDAKLDELKAKYDLAHIDAICRDSSFKIVEVAMP